MESMFGNNPGTVTTYTKHLLERSPLEGLILSALLLCAMLVVRFLANRAIMQNKRISRDTQRRWMVNTRSLLVVVLIFGLTVVWAEEIRAMALSMVAVAAAIAISTKELILCAAGTFLKTVSRPFSLGDRIEIEGLRGDVIDQNLFTTTILEIGPKHLTHQYTGRAITIPNSQFLAHEVINESHTDDYVLHVFTVPIQRIDDWRNAAEILLKAAGEVCSPFVESARLHMDFVAKTRGLEVPNLEPRIHFQLPDPETINLIIRVCTPARQKGRIEQAIVRRFLEQFTPVVDTEPSLDRRA